MRPLGNFVEAWFFNSELQSVTIGSTWPWCNSCSNRQWNQSRRVAGRSPRCRAPSCRPVYCSDCETCGVHPSTSGRTSSWSTGDMVEPTRPGGVMHLCARHLWSLQSRRPTSYGRDMCRRAGSRSLSSSSGPRTSASHSTGAATRSARTASSRNWCQHAGSSAQAAGRRRRFRARR
jgi:hypothetical protein